MARIQNEVRDAILAKMTPVKKEKAQKKVLKEVEKEKITHTKEKKHE